MKVYLDLILILNFFFDFILLLSVSYVLKRNISINKLLIGSFIGGISILFLFFKINSVELFIYKIIISLLMLIVSFGYRNFHYFFRNFVYLYIHSIVLGGFLYFLNNIFSYKHSGIIFFNNSMSINVIFLIIFSPLILYIYSKELKKYKSNYSNYYKVKLYINNIEIKLTAFLDTGNKLIDPYKKRSIILVDKKKLIFDINEFKMVLVPYKTVNYEGILRCIKINKISIEGIGDRYHFLVGIMEDSFKMDGVDCIINTKLLEG